MKKYLDITVFISPGTDDAFTVRAEADDQGEVGRSTLRLPFQLRDLAGTVFGVSETARSLVPGGPEDAPSTSQKLPDSRSVAEFGIELFEALFQGETRDVLAAVESRAQHDPDTGVRIRLSMDLQAPGMAQVASLPWELICRRNGRPLVVSTQTPLVRALDVPKPAEPGPFHAPLRILALMSNPSGTETLNLEKERSLIEQNWARLPGVKVDFVRPIRAELLRQLAAGGYHVVHYMGHGDFEADAGGTLLLENEDGSPDPISGDAFAMFLADSPLRMVFLNACKTGTTTERSGTHPFAGVATALIRERIPAVVAMQFPISDNAAIAFAQTFYERIAQGFPVDAAVVEGRKVLYSSKHSEWATPVLYLRSKDGMLFSDFATAAPPITSSREDSAPQTAGTTPEDPDETWGPGAPDDLRVFLATPDQDREKLHAQISGTLREMEGVRVIDSVALDEEAHAQTVDDLVRSADLCVHLLSANAGRRLDVDDGEPLRTFPLEQLEMGRQAAKSQLVVITREDRQSIGNAAYAARVDELAELPRDKARFELLITDKNQIIAAVIEKLGELKLARETNAASSSANGSIEHTAFVDSHVDDQELAIDLLAYLEEHNISTEFSSSSSNAPANLKQLDEAVRKASLYVIFAVSTDRKWISNRKIAIMKSAVKSRAPLLVASYTDTLGEGGESFKFSSARPDISTLNDPDRSWVDALFPPQLGEEA